MCSKNIEHAQKNLNAVKIFFEQADGTGMYVLCNFAIWLPVGCAMHCVRKSQALLCTVLHTAGKPKRKKKHIHLGFFQLLGYAWHHISTQKPSRNYVVSKWTTFDPLLPPPYHVVFFIKEGLLSKSVGARPGRGGIDTTQFMDEPLLPIQLTLNFLVAISQALHTQQTHLTHLFEVNFRRDIIYIACKTNHTVCISF